MTNTSNPNDIIWGVKGIARELGVSPKTIDNWIYTGKLPVKHFNRRVYIQRKVLHELFELV